ncbi:MAG TPA: hypothetical protein VLX58_06370 [Bryobacteraceae bacterium]|nr:hypothetical protein [Bryobacteraceae bacterium]
MIADAASLGYKNIAASYILKSLPSFIERVFMTQHLPPRTPDDTVHQEQLELAESELEVALLFANLSSAAYSLGRLHHATDARTKAELACTRAAALLTIPEIDEPEAYCVKSMLHEVQGALARLPIAGEFHLQV